MRVAAIITLLIIALFAASAGSSTNALTMANAQVALPVASSTV